MNLMITLFLSLAVLCSSCATANYSHLHVKHQMPDDGIIISGNKLLHDGQMIAELRYFFTSSISENQHKGLAIYYEREKRLVWIFPEEGREEDVKRGRFSARGDTDGKVGGPMMFVSLLTESSFIGKGLALSTQSSYVFPVEHGTSKLINREWHLW